MTVIMIADLMRSTSSNGSLCERGAATLGIPLRIDVSDDEFVSDHAMAPALEPGWRADLRECSRACKGWPPYIPLSFAPHGESAWPLNFVPPSAVLIDADNASPRIDAGLFDEIEDWRSQRSAHLRRFLPHAPEVVGRILSKHGIIPHQTSAYTAGKNASDIALVIDAMDLLHSGRFYGFCLVSSESDFTRLAARIREHGMEVFGFGAQKTPESFRQACRRLIYTENLLPEAPAPDRDGAAEAKPLQPPNAAIPLLRKVIVQMDDEGSWIGLGGVGQRLASLAQISTHGPTDM